MTTATAEIETEAAEVKEIAARFEDFNLRQELLKAIERKGFESPMPVQVHILEDHTLTEGDLIVQAKTGSGKTLAFAIPIFNQMEHSTREPQVLVLSPTRELAQQTAREFAWLGADLGARVATLVGGLDMERQTRSLKEGATVIVGTPGRVLDHVRRGSFKTDSVKVLVLDEGDHMLDMGFRDELEAIMSGMEKLEKTWLFSATMPPDVVSLARRYLDAPRKVSLVADVTYHEDIAQKTYIIPARKRFEGLANVMLWENPSRALLFCATKVETQDISDRLCDEGFKACAIHGDMSQRERNAALSSLRGGRVMILVATDVAARGLDIDGISHVIQFGLPSNLEAFVHRSGRTGRAGHEGSNLVLLTSREARQFRQMTHGSNLQMQIIPAPDASEISGHTKSRFETLLFDHANETDEYHTWADELLNREDARMMIAGLLARAYGEQPQGYSIRADVESEMNRDKNRSDLTPGFQGRGQPFGGNRPARPTMEGGVQIQLGQGRNEGWEVGALLGAICRSMGISRDDVGNIRLRDDSASVELSAKAAELLESRKSRMTKEGLVCSAIRALPKTGGEGRSYGRPYGRGSRPGQERQERTDRSDRSERGGARSRKSDSDRSRSRRYN
ncbi:MAG: DEAD/DEAH box helicase [Synergistaceae bacterium]|jgi:ATP-dependent RNA helicase DeaD|nr:DEAD/DEAH box helicase [Synergistaceae bacterium]